MAPAKSLYLVQDVVPMRGFALLYGQFASGKSFLALHLAFCVATGREFFERRVTQGGVLYLALEGGSGMRLRIAAAMEHDASLKSSSVALVDHLVRFRGEQNDLAALQATVERISEELQHRGEKLRLIVVDTWARALNGADENASAHVGEMLDAIETIGRISGAAVLAVGHSGKNQSQGHRGHSSVLAACDTAWEVKKGAHGLAAECVKNKDGSGDQRFGFALKTVTVCTDEFGGPVTSCVVEEAAVPVTQKGRAPHPLDAEILAALRELTSRSGHPAGGRFGLPEDVRPVEKSALVGWLRANRGSTGQSEANWRKQIDRRIASLETSGRIGSAIGRDRDRWIWLMKDVSSDLGLDRQPETPTPTL